MDRIDTEQRSSLIAFASGAGGNSLEGEGISFRIRVAASALVASFVINPTVTIAAMLWARHESIKLHPTLAAINPPTISRAIADPIIGDPFAYWMIVVGGAQAFAVYRLTLAMKRTALKIGPPRHRALMSVLLSFIVMAEATAIVGVIMLSQYTGSISDYLHQLGSYLMFAGNGVGILLCAILVWLDHNQRRGSEKSTMALPLPYNIFFHTWFAGVVCVVYIVFGILFFAFDFLASFHNYFFRLAFSMVELAVLALSVIYLGGFVFPMYRHERYLLSRRDPARDPEPAAGEA